MVTSLMPPLTEPNEDDERYKVASQIHYAYNGSTETDVWKATRKADGRQVVRKRMATPIWQSEHELSMHLAASSAPGTSHHKQAVAPWRGFCLLRAHLTDKGSIVSSCIIIGVIPLLDTFWDQATRASRPPHLGDALRPESGARPAAEGAAGVAAGLVSLPRRVALDLSIIARTIHARKRSVVWWASWRICDSQPTAAPPQDGPVPHTITAAAATAATTTTTRRCNKETKEQSNAKGLATDRQLRR